jgi:hypothetical protein
VTRVWSLKDLHGRLPKASGGKWRIQGAHKMGKGCGEGDSSPVPRSALQRPGGCQLAACEARFFLIESPRTSRRGQWRDHETAPGLECPGQHNERLAGIFAVFVQNLEPSPLATVKSTACAFFVNLTGRGNHSGTKNCAPTAV